MKWKNIGPKNPIESLILKHTSHNYNQNISLKKKEFAMLKA